jgi:hypothetical protein
MVRVPMIPVHFNTIASQFELTNAGVTSENGEPLFMREASLGILRLYVSYSVKESLFENIEPGSNALLAVS